MSAPALDRAIAPQEAPKATLRADVQGLRAVAVLAVIADHLFQWPAGGFVGVDIFFVISGFLITGLLLREHDRTGTISFSGFYRRRIKRIMPAAVAVLLVTVAAASAFFNSARFMSTLADAAYSLFFAANWHFAAVGTDYFQATGPVSPLQHFWSLSVEEQFYFVWPWLMLIIFLSVGRKVSTRRAHQAIAAAMIAITIASFAWGWFDTRTEPTVAYFSTLTRAWELGLGALIAVSAGVLTKIPDKLRPALGWLGIAAILAGIFVTKASVGFPVPNAALPVVGCAVVIASGTGGRVRYLAPLTNRVTRWLGDVSYSLYLWHFPVIVFLGVLIPSGPVYFSIALLVIFALALGSYYLIEEPLRTSPWLLPKGSAQRRQAEERKAQRLRRRGQPRVTIAGRVFYGAMAGLLVLNVALWASAIQRQNLQVDAATTSFSVSGGATSQTLTPLQRKIASALQATTWPALSPSLDSVINKGTLSAGLQKCGAVEPPPEESCTFGSRAAKHTVVLVGDSTAAFYGSPLQQIVDAHSDWKLVDLAMFGCLFSSAQYQNTDPAVVAACPKHNDNVRRRIAELKPDLVVVTNNYVLHADSKSGATVPVGAWAASLQEALVPIASSAKKVVLLSPPPSDKEIADCYTPLSHPSDCVSHVQSTWTAIASAERRVAAKLNGSFVNSQDWYCVSGACPAFVGHTPVKQDVHHITSQYGALIVPEIEEAIPQLGT